MHARTWGRRLHKWLTRLLLAFLAQDSKDIDFSPKGWPFGVPSGLLEFQMESQKCLPSSSNLLGIKLKTLSLLPSVPWNDSQGDVPGVLDQRDLGIHRLNAWIWGF